MRPTNNLASEGSGYLPTADARDGRRGNQPWSVITTPVSA